MSDELVHQAESGDLRPAFNPRAVTARRLSPAEADIVEPILRGRLLGLARHIADASSDPRPNLSLDGAGSFFCLAETLRRIHAGRLRQTLLMLLDEFIPLEPRAYDQLYLWSIIYLSRHEREDVGLFWPLAIALDQRYRAAPWQRPAGTTPVERPYRFLELLCWGYVQFTLQRGLPPGEKAVRRLYPSLTACLRGIYDDLADEERGLLLDTLRQMDQEEVMWPRRRRAYGDALGFLQRSARPMSPASVEA